MLVQYLRLRKIFEGNGIKPVSNSATLIQHARTIKTRKEHHTDFCMVSASEERTVQQDDE